MNTRQCAFIQARACPIDVDEIALDVCKLCIDAWKTSAEIQTITRATLLGPTTRAPVIAPVFQQPITLISPAEPDTRTRAREAYDMLHNLDTQFIDDQISAEEYVTIRRGLVDHLATQRSENGEKPSFLSQATESGMISLKPDPDEVLLPAPINEFHVITLDENMDILNGGDHPHKNVLPLLLIERNKGKFGVNKYPTEWKVPKSLNLNKLESIYDLYEQLRETQEKILFQFDGTKLGLLGKKNNRILCMVLESDERIEDYSEEINYLTKLLSDTSSIEDFINALPIALNKTRWR